MQTVKQGSGHWYIRVQGEGALTVVIDTRLGGFSAEWWNIQDQVAQYARVVTYDRAGYGWSGRAGLPRTTERIAVELRGALRAAGIEPPFILVGHSQGGLNMQHFARLFPDDVVGAVFVDPTTLDNHRFQTELPSAIYKGSGVDKVGAVRWMGALARLRLLRLLKPMLMKSPPFYYYKTITPEQTEIIWKHHLRPDSYPTVADEYAQAYTPDNARAMLAHDFPPVPLTVIYHDAAVVIKEIVQYGGLSESDAGKVESLWEELTHSYLALSPHSRWQIASGSSHMIHLDRPDLVSAALIEMVTAVKAMAVQH